MPADGQSGPPAGKKVTSRESAERFLADLYGQLRNAAKKAMAGEACEHTLTATALVHEAFLRVLGQCQVVWQQPGHFYSAVAEAMRRVLIDHARAKGAHKRGKGWSRAALDISGIADAMSAAESGGIVALDGALSRLELVDPEAARVVRLRFYAGMTIDQIAEALGLSPRTVNRDWQFARAWLARELERDIDPET